MLLNWRSCSKQQFCFHLLQLHRSYQGVSVARECIPEKGHIVWPLQLHQSIIFKACYLTILPLKPSLTAVVNFRFSSLFFSVSFFVEMTWTGYVSKFSATYKGVKKNQLWWHTGNILYDEKESNMSHFLLTVGQGRTREIFGSKLDQLVVNSVCRDHNCFTFWLQLQFKPQPLQTTVLDTRSPSHLLSTSSLGLCLMEQLMFRWVVPECLL